LDDLGFEREELERRGVWEGGLLISRGAVVLLGLYSFDLVNWDGYSFHCPSKHSVLPKYRTVYWKCGGINAASAPRDNHPV
jgi:hypothetical protein